MEPQWQICTPGKLSLDLLGRSQYFSTGFKTTSQPREKRIGLLEAIKSLIKGQYKGISIHQQGICPHSSFNQIVVSIDLLIYFRIRCSP